MSQKEGNKLSKLRVDQDQSQIKPAINGESRIEVKRNRPTNSHVKGTDKQSLPGEAYADENVELPESVTLNQLGFTVQLEQFISTWYQSVSIALLRALRDNKMQAGDAYHKYRQVLVYLETLHQCVYDEDLAEDTVNFLTTRMDLPGYDLDKNITQNYINFFQKFFQVFIGREEFKKQEKIADIMKQQQYALDNSYGYEPDIVR